MNDLPPATLSLWRTQQRGETGSSEAGVGALVEVPAAALIGVPATTPVRMRLPSGIRLDVPTGTDPTWLGAVLKSLSGS